MRSPLSAGESKQASNPSAGLWLMTLGLVGTNSAMLLCQHANCPKAQAYKTPAQHDAMQVHEILFALVY